MAPRLRRTRKNTDRDITRLNSVGLSLSAIGTRLNCHATSVTLRLKLLRIPAADTRRSFMDDLYNDLTENQQDGLADVLEEGSISIRDYIKSLILSDLHVRQSEISNSKTFHEPESYKPEIPGLIE